MRESEHESEYASAPSSHGSALLGAGVPLSLLMDLVDPAGPGSAEILRVEAVQADLVAERRVIADLTRWETQRDTAEGSTETG